MLHIAAALNALFYIKTPQNIPITISNEAIVAAVDLINTCNQHVAYLAGMGEIDEYISSLQQVQTGILMHICLFFLFKRNI